MTTDVRTAGQQYPLPWISDALQTFASRAFVELFAGVDDGIFPNKIDVYHALAPGPAPDVYYTACNQLISWFHACFFLYRGLQNHVAADRSICLAFYFIHHMPTFRGLLSMSMGMSITDATRQEFIALSSIPIEPRMYPRLSYTLLLHKICTALF